MHTKAILAVLVVLTWVPRPLPAQVLVRPFGSLQYTHWLLDVAMEGHGTTANTVGLQLGASVTNALSLHFIGALGAEEGYEPGIRLAGIQGRLEGLNRYEGFAVFATVGGGVLEVDADEREELQRGCTAETACVWEGQSYTSGIGPWIAAAVGVRFGIGAGFALEPELRLLSFRSGDAGRNGEGGTFGALSAAIAWRPVRDQ